MSRAEAAIDALIDGPVTTVLNQSVPGDMLLQRVETSYEACNVYLLASYTPDARTWATAQAAIAATVYACENIASINLYLNGMAPAYYGRPMGAVTPISNTLDAYIVELQQLRVRIMRQEPAYMKRALPRCTLPTAAIRCL